MSSILADSGRVLDGVRAAYRHLHMNPELSMQEHATAEYVAHRMSGLGYECQPCAGTGVVCVLRNGAGPTVGFRADMDGLPLRETTGLPYASTAVAETAGGDLVPVMHACGHDIHVAAALGAAELLVLDRDSWSGTVVFVFQPGEETAEGAIGMVRDGLWDKAPLPDVMLGQHVSTSSAGRLEVPVGPAMAMADSWRVTVTGKGGHGSRPHETRDPIVTTAHIIVRIQSLVSREIDPQASAVVTVGVVQGGAKANIIPSECAFTVNVRALDRDVRKRVLYRLRKIIELEAQLSETSVEISETSRFPLLLNDPVQAERILTTFASCFDPELVSERAPKMGSEDFGNLSEQFGVPSVFWFIGGMDENDVESGRYIPPNHSSEFAPVMEPTLSCAVEAAYVAVVSTLSSAAG